MIQHYDFTSYFQRRNSFEELFNNRRLAEHI